MATLSRRHRAPAFPRERAHLAPLLRERSRIEMLAAALIDLLDSFDAPLADLEDELDCCSAEDAQALVPMRRSHSSYGAGSFEDAEPSEDDEPDELGQLAA
jgi:hypothetical protein